jgi:hypothetical protein
VDAMVAAYKYAAAAALCGDAHDMGTFCHYTLPPPPDATGAPDGPQARGRQQSMQNRLFTVVAPNRRSVRLTLACCTAHSHCI